MNGIVEKPQFDTDFFKVSKAIHITEFLNGGDIRLDTDAIIVNSSPIELQVIFFTKDETCYFGNEETLYIKIDDVVFKKFKIKTLQEV